MNKSDAQTRYVMVNCRLGEQRPTKHCWLVWRTVVVDKEITYFCKERDGFDGRLHYGEE